MPEKPTTLPQWGTDVGATVEPSAAEKGTGWVVSTKPPARFFNWILNLIYQWIQYLNAPVGTGAGAAIDGTGGSTSGPGLKGTGGAPNGYGLHGQGTGTGYGAYGKGGATDAEGGFFEADSGGDGNGCFARGYGIGSGFYGVASGTGVGGYFLAAGSGPGLVASSATGHGAKVSADSTSPAKASLNVGPQNAVASSPESGDLQILSTTKGIVTYDGSEHYHYPVRRHTILADESETVGAASAEYATSKFTIPSETLRAGSVMRARIAGTVSAAAAGAQLDLILNDGSTSMQATLSIDNTGAFWMDVQATFRSVGAAGEVLLGGIGASGGASGGAGLEHNAFKDDDTLDTTADIDVSLYITGLSGTNTAVLEQFVIDLN